MRVLLMAYGSRGDIAPLAELAATLRAVGAEVRVCAPPDEEFAELLAGVGAEHVPFGRDVRVLRTGAPSSDAAAFAAGWSPRTSIRSARRPRTATCWSRAA
ncbi:hypothetical protein OG594_24235 [Streptomyces sp. NBC_01214]|uniref:hypothetical protein n=1 Tax=Streptomyces sp. NBC_01214 TaxID=2903777 RepID=UPI002254BB7C|nr:hypothetical protein [Streptomyces sp. NBC_01214]MCX4804687.1 hypothetical protein [Streptomyces sp. NBC_01214]